MKKELLSLQRYGAPQRHRGPPGRVRIITFADMDKMFGKLDAQHAFGVRLNRGHVRYLKNGGNPGTIK